MSSLAICANTSILRIEPSLLNKILHSKMPSCLSSGGTEGMKVMGGGEGRESSRVRPRGDWPRACFFAFVAFVGAAAFLPLDFMACFLTFVAFVCASASRVPHTLAPTRNWMQIRLPTRT